MKVVIRSDFDLHLYLGDDPVPNRPYHVGEQEFLDLVRQHGPDREALKRALGERGEEEFDDVMYA